MNATPAIDEALVVVVVNRSWRRGMSDEETYHCAQGEWRVGPEVRSRARYVVAVANRLVVGVYQVDQWSETGNKPDLRDRVVRKWAFIGSPAIEYETLIGTHMMELPENNRSSFLRFLDGYPGQDSHFHTI